MQERYAPNPARRDGALRVLALAKCWNFRVQEFLFDTQGAPPIFSGRGNGDPEFWKHLGAQTLGQKNVFLHEFLLKDVFHLLNPSTDTEGNQKGLQYLVSGCRGATGPLCNTAMVRELRQQQISVRLQLISLEPAQSHLN